LRTLITGGCGFIGSHLVDLLVEKKWDVRVLDRYLNPFYSLPNQVEFIKAEVNNRGALRSALKNVDIVYHLAWSGVHLTSNLDLRGHVETNLLSSLTFFEVCLEMQIKRIVFISSGGTVYGKICKIPTPENHTTAPVCAYGVTKLSIEKYLSLYGFLHGVEYVILRPSVPYGERQNPVGIQGAVNVFLGKMLHGKPIEIWGDGQIKRDFFYVGDLADALYRAGTCDEKCEVFNIGGGKSISLNQLPEVLNEVTGIQVPVHYLPGRSFDAAEVCLDITKAREKMNWEPQTPLMVGLTRTWNWMKTSLSTR